jgi:hypothetical protein
VGLDHKCLSYLSWRVFLHQYRNDEHQDGGREQSRCWIKQNQRRIGKRS